MTFWKKLVEPPAVEVRPAPVPAPPPPVDDSPFTPMAVALATWIVAETLGATPAESIALVAYPHAVHLAAEMGANRAQADSQRQGTVPPTQ